MFRKENVIAFYTLLRKEVVRFMRIWTQTLLPPVINQSLYFIIFGTFIGSQISDVHGVSYMTFIVPGLVMMAVISSAYMNVSSSFFGTKFMKNIEELLVSPAPRWAIIGGYAGGGVLRGILVGVIVFIISVFFTHPVIFNFGIILLFIVLTSLLFSLGGLINGIVASKFDDVSIFPTFILTPLTYFGGVFYSVKSLPEFWQYVSWFNPIVYMIDGFRYGFFGISDSNIFINMGILITFTLAAIIVSSYLLKKGIGLRT